MMESVTLEKVKAQAEEGKKYKDLVLGTLKAFVVGLLAGVIILAKAYVFREIAIMFAIPVAKDITIHQAIGAILLTQFFKTAPESKKKATKIKLKKSAKVFFRSLWIILVSWFIAYMLS